MKKSTFPLKRILVFVPLMGILYFFGSFKAVKKKDCNPEELMSIGIEKLKNYSYVKHYPFNFKEKKKNKPVELLKQNITLTRGVKYRFFSVPNASFEGKPVISIYNNDKLEFPVASTYNQNMKRFYDDICFECKTTGNYCITFSFLDGLEGCAVGIMSFLEKTS